jgi:monothiol glutaredoxin
MDATIRQKIENDIKNNKVMLYMKGTESAPMCGFSARAVGILKEYKVSFKAFNVLDDEYVRAGIKEYSDWPTIPQLYINGEFIGGSDIMAELYESGELAKKLGVAKS